MFGGHCPVFRDFMRQVIPVGVGPESQWRPLIGQNLTMAPSHWLMSPRTCDTEEDQNNNNSLTQISFNS